VHSAIQVLLQTVQELLPWSDFLSSFWIIIFTKIQSS
jgi:hypothetical protein